MSMIFLRCFHNTHRHKLPITIRTTKVFFLTLMKPRRIPSGRRMIGFTVGMSQCHKPPISDGLYHPFLW